MPRRVRLCLVGFGRWGRNYIKAARDSGIAEVTDVISGHLPVVDGASVHHPDDLDRVVFGVDAVILATNPAAVPEMCERVLYLNKPVMIEKPAGLSLEDADWIAHSEEELRQMVLVNHQHLFSDAIEALHRDGSPWPLCARWHGPTAHDFPGLWDYGPHAVSAILAARGRMPDRVQRFSLGQGRDVIKMWFGDVVDRVHVLSDHHEKIATVHTEENGTLDGRLIYDGYTPAEPPLTRSVRAFAKAVQDGGTDDWRFGAKWAVDVARVLES